MPSPLLAKPRTGKKPWKKRGSQEGLQDFSMGPLFPLDLPYGGSLNWGYPKMDGL